VIEKLTENERFALRNPLNTRSVRHAGIKAMGIISQHESDRAALVEQAAYYKRESDGRHTANLALCAENKRLTDALAAAERERDEFKNHWHNACSVGRRLEARAKELETERDRAIAIAENCNRGR
jgi:hypothetical protein